MIFLLPSILIFFFFSLNPIASQCCISFCYLSVWISCMYTYIFSLSSLPPSNPHPTPLDPHRAPSWAPCANSSIPLAIHFTHASVYMAMLFSLFIPSSPSRLPPAATFPHVHSLHQCLYILFTIYILFAHRCPHLQEVVELIFSFLERISKLFKLRNNPLRHSKYFSPQT